jgi:hypothetical protein
VETLVESLVTLALITLSGLLGQPAALDRVQPPISALVYAGVDFFSGEVADISSGSIEVVRSALGKNDQRRFSLTDDTKFEGRARRGSRVTVGYYEKSPDVAVTVIVRDND